MLVIKNSVKIWKKIICNLLYAIFTMWIEEGGRNSKKKKINSIHFRKIAKFFDNLNLYSEESFYPFPREDSKNLNDIFQFDPDQPIKGKNIFQELRSCEKMYKKDYMEYQNRYHVYLVFEYCISSFPDWTPFGQLSTSPLKQPGQ